MNITRTNYESYFIDYLDGTLSTEQVRELQAFLLLHSDLAEILEETPPLPLKVPLLPYAGKETLKKDELHACTDYYPIAIAENCLTPADQQFLKRHPIFYEIADLYRKIKLLSDDRLRYPYKKKLYRKSHKTPVFYRFSVAAILMLLIGLVFLFRQPIQTPVTPLQKYNQPLELPPPQLLLSTEIKPFPTIPALFRRRPAKKISSLSASLLREASMIPIIQQPIKKLALPTDNYTLNSKKQQNFMPQASELQLTENARAWKSSVNFVLSENIFTSMIHAGRVIAEKIKNEE